ncbi:PAS domain S-box protein [Desulfovibrio inopinatus]|uniref:PAS domain S-box protein n=1 Tax=Desulfovibrio inopinatus TaxID=102109 RepID=UPI000407636A|nr:PAS domain S-box protein [Desulfovibrio inopinatus]
MIQLGTFDIRTIETFNEGRRKILRLAKRLGFNEIEGSRLASIFSEITRPEPGSPPVSVAIRLSITSDAPSLAFRFSSLSSFPGHIRRFFDVVEFDSPHAMLCLRRLPREQLQLSDANLAELRDMLARQSREELLQALKEKNDALEQEVTERRQAEEALRSAQAEMTQIFNTAGGGMRVIDNDFTVLKVNNAFVELTGYDRERIIGQKCFTMFGGPTCKTAACPLHRIQAGEHRVEFTTRKANSQGIPIYCDVSVTPFTSSEGERLGIIEDFRDVTERVKAQERIQQSESKYRELVESAKSIILKLDLNGYITFFNEYAQTFFGWRSEDIVGRPIVGTIVPASEAGGRDLEQLISNIIQHPEQYEKNENENMCRDGSRVWVSWTNQITLDEHTGDPTGLLCIGLDATERKKAQDNLHDALDIISGSIRYASRIQRAVLPPDDDFTNVFSRHFIIWYPRDIVGGDIYWSAKWGQGHLFALGDCTGHGVPGAFMTLITTGALSRALTEVEPGYPGKLLGRAHQIVQSRLNQHTANGESDDGMELGLCYVEPGNNTMIYAGARFPLFVVQGKNIEEIKPNKKGIGYRGIPQEQQFEERRIHLEPGLRLYMISDGVFDQIGGEKRRGFGKKRFKHALLSLVDIPFPQHGQRLYAMLEDYQGDESRRDDISMLGLEF